MIAPQLVEIRRAVHRHPELGFQEHRTATLVAEFLRSLGIRVETGVGKTGVVGLIGSGGPVIALRAEMDALPIQELNCTDYASQVPGVMHACGHDVHVACLVGAAMLLQEARPKGQVRLLFQPSEEGMDDEGKSGAVRMIEDGAIDGVEAIFGLHVDGKYPIGALACSPGCIMAAMDNFEIVIAGHSVHGAQAYLGVDAILLAAQVVNAIHTIVSRRISALDSGVISIGTILGGTKENILAEKVELRGTIRSFDPEVHQTLKREIDRSCHVARAMGGEYRLLIKEGYPALINDSSLVALLRDVVRDMMGPEATRDCEPEMGADDFSFYLQRVPGCYFMLGTGTEGEPVRPLHHPRFDVDESALPVGAAILAQVAVRYLTTRDGHLNHEI